MKKLIVGLLVASALVASAGCKKKDVPSGGVTGVAECDEYIVKYQACIDKMPAAQKATVQQGFQVQQTAWKTMASTPDGKTALKPGCKATLESLKTNALCK